MHRLRLTIALALLVPACAAEPAEPPPADKPNLSPAPITAPPSDRPVARPMKFELPDDEIGLAVHRLVDAQERLVGDAANNAHAMGMEVVRQRPAEIVRAFSEAYDKLPQPDMRRWALASTLANLGIDEALPALIKIADQPIPTVPASPHGTAASAVGPHSDPAAQTAAKQPMLNVMVAVDGIAKIARTSSVPATKQQANDQLFTYFTHPEVPVKETAVVGYLRGQSSLPAAKITAKLKLAAPDRYMVDLAWGKSPAGIPMAAGPGKKASDVPTSVPTRK